MLRSLYLYLSLFMCAFVPGVGSAQRPPALGTRIGALSLTAGNSYTSLSSSTFVCLDTAATCPPNLVFSYLVVRNRDTADPAYLLLRSAPALPIMQMRIDPNSVLNDFQVYPIAPRIISVLGSAAGVELEILAYFYPN